MACPKCGYIMTDFDVECPRCIRLPAGADRIDEPRRGGIT